MKLAIACLLFGLFLCQNENNVNKNLIDTEGKIESLLDSNSRQIFSRYICPDSFYRTQFDTNSFEYYLSHLPLKPINSFVKLYDGSVKSHQVYSSVVDMEISPVDLQQCADAVMRLRGEYLYHTKQYSKITFRFLGDGKMHAYLDYVGTDRSYKKFRKYMDYVFSFANTASLLKQLQAVSYSDMKVGDVLIQKGNPYGHAVIVVDMCRNKKGQKKYLLAQSYMPAQETQILKNPKNKGSWYDLTNEFTIQTPEWNFDTTNLRRW